MKRELEEFEYLWTTAADRHCLVKVGAGSDDVVILDVMDETALVIEDDAVAREVTRRMREAGVEVRNTIPERKQ